MAQEAGKPTGDQQVLKGNSNGMKAFSAVIAVVAVIAGVYAMTEPMGQRIDFLERQLAGQTAAMAIDDVREQQNRDRTTSMLERFKEVETQFVGLRRVHGLDVLRLEEKIKHWTTESVSREEMREKHAAEKRDLERRILLLERAVNN